MIINMAIQSKNKKDKLSYKKKRPYKDETL